MIFVRKFGKYKGKSLKIFTQYLEVSLVLLMIVHLCVYIHIYTHMYTFMCISTANFYLYG